MEGHFRNASSPQTLLRNRTWSVKGVTHLVQPVSSWVQRHITLQIPKMGVCNPNQTVPSSVPCIYHVPILFVSLILWWCLMTCLFSLNTITMLTFAFWSSFPTETFCTFVYDVDLTVPKPVPFHPSGLHEYLLTWLVNIIAFDTDAGIT